MGSLLVFGCVNFTSCSDLDKEIENVNSVAVKNSELISTLDQTVTALDAALREAQADADAAMAEAKSARTEAAAATAAAASAKAEAVAEAKAQVDALKSGVDAALASKVDKAEVEALLSEAEIQLATIAGRLDAIDVDLKAVKDALALKADKAALDALAAKVDVNIAALENYDRLLSDLALADKANEDAIAAVVADLTALQAAVAEAAAAGAANAAAVTDLQAKLQKSEGDINTINNRLTQFFNAIRTLINQIQSLVYVPETLEGYMTAQGYSLGDEKSEIFVKATYEITPSHLAMDVFSENTFFRAVEVKAGKAETFAAEVVYTDYETGRIEVLARITPEQEMAYETLVSGGNIALSFNIADPEWVAMNNYGWDAEYDAGSYVASSYVGVVPADEVFDNLLDGNVVIYNEKDEAAVDAPVTAELATPYNLAPGAKALFGSYGVRVLVGDEYMTLDEAAYFLGMEFEVENAVSVKYFDPAGAEITSSPVSVSGEGLAVTAQFAETASLKGEALVGYGAEVVADSFEVNGVAFGFPVTVTYTIAGMMPTPDGAQWILPEDLAMEFYGGKDVYINDYELVPAKSVLDFGVTDLTKQEMAAFAIENGILSADEEYLLLGFDEGTAFGGEPEWYQLLMGLPSAYEVIPDSATSGVVRMVAVDAWFGTETVTDIPYSGLTETSCTFDFSQWLGLGKFTATKAAEPVEVIVRG